MPLLTRGPANQIYEPEYPMQSELRLDAYQLARPMVGEIAPSERERILMEHGRYLAGTEGLGSVANAPSYDAEYNNGDFLDDLEQEDDVYGSGIFDFSGRAPTTHADLGVFADNPNLPGFIGREQLFAVSQEITDITNNADVVVVPGGGMSYVDRGLPPQPFYRWGQKASPLDLQKAPPTSRGQVFTSMTPGWYPEYAPGMQFPTPIALPQRPEVVHPVSPQTGPYPVVPGPTFTHRVPPYRLPPGRRPPPERPHLTPRRPIRQPGRAPMGPGTVPVDTTVPGGAAPPYAMPVPLPGVQPPLSLVPGSTSVSLPPGPTHRPGMPTAVTMRPGRAPQQVPIKTGEGTYQGRPVRGTTVPAPSLTTTGTLVQKRGVQSSQNVSKTVPLPGTGRRTGQQQSAQNVSMTAPVTRAARATSGFGALPPPYRPGAVPEAPASRRIGRVSIVNAGVIAESVINPKPLPGVPFQVQQNVLPLQDISRIGAPQSWVVRPQSRRLVQQTQGFGAEDTSDGPGIGSYLFAGALVGAAAAFVVSATEKKRRRA